MSGYNMISVSVAGMIINVSPKFKRLRYVNRPRFAMTTQSETLRRRSKKAEFPG